MPRFPFMTLSAQILCMTCFTASFAGFPQPTLADIEPPPSDEVPEEILRNELIFEARSPIDGSPMSAAEYAALQERLQTPTEAPLVNQDLRYLIFLLELRGAIKPILPFIP
jgi:hypothetical protein